VKGRKKEEAELCLPAPRPTKAKRERRRKREIRGERTLAGGQG